MTGLAFIVVRGPALAGKTAVGRALAEALAAGGRRRVACISQDDLASRWIVGHDLDLAREVELVYRQLRLLSAAYIRAGYHVVLDGAFAAYHDGVAATHDTDLRELLALVGTIQNVRSLFVAVTAPIETLLARARESERWDARAVEAVYRAFEAAGTKSPVTIDTSRASPEEAAAEVLEHFGVRS